MNIGILTLPFNANYGGILQGYALQTALERLGHRAAHVNRLPYHHLPLLLRPAAYAKRIVEQQVMGRNKRIFFEAYQNAIVRHTNEFVARHIHLRECRAASEVQQGEFDAFVVGSDQVWRAAYWKDISVPFLGFAEGWDVRRVAYAASFGLDSWPLDERATRRCAALLRQFDRVSVREASGIGLCRTHLGCDAVQMPDPTLLLRRADYEALLPGDAAATALGEAPAGDHLFAYLLDARPSTTRLVEDIARRTGLPIHELSATDDIHLPVEACVRPPVETWLRGIAQARLVVTNSFHGCVFALLFAKPFVAVGKRIGGLTRIHSLLSQFGLPPAVLDEQSPTAADFAVLDGGSPAVEQRLEELRDEGLSFLHDALLPCAGQKQTR